ncbi:MAG: methyltransferase domain-containing protein [Solirubrobacterales bacterium]
MFEERARGVEFMDAPDTDPRLTEESYRFMKLVNRIGGGTRVVREFLAAELPGQSRDKLIRILDIGAGGGDIPLAILRWARRRGYQIEFTCVDFNEAALDATQKAVDRSGGGAGIKLVDADIFQYQPVKDFDYAVGSMVFHHFTNDEIRRLLTHLCGFVRRALLINDLHRNWLNYLACSILVIPLDREIRHDARLSILRGFKPAELRAILREHDPAAAVTRSWFSRVAGVVRFDRKEGE